MSGCELIGCKYYIDGKCTEPNDYVNRFTGEDMCSRNTDAIPREDYIQKEKVMDNKQLQQETNLAIIKASELVITNNKDFELAGAMLVELKTYAKRVEEYWAEPKKSAHKAWKDICAKEKAFLEPLSKAEKTIKTKMGEYQRQQEAKERAIREELERRQREEAERLMKEAEEKEAAGDILGADLALAQAELMEQSAPVAAIQQPNAAGISSRKVWKARVTDESQVPVEVAGIVIRPVDLSALNNLAKATKGKAKIAGVEFYEEIIMSARGR